MNQYGLYPAFDLFYDTRGNLVDSVAEERLVKWLASDVGQNTTDIVLISHGWNNDLSEARELYANFFSTVASVQTTQTIGADGSFAIIAIFWPSKRFADTDLIPGGAASSTAIASAGLEAALEQLREVLPDNPAADAKIEHAKKQIIKLATSPSAQDEFVAALVSALPLANGELDEGLDESITAVRSGSPSGSTVLMRLNSPIFPAMPIPNQSVGHALGKNDVFGGIASAANRLVNYFTYYTMKERAGLIGRNGVAQTIIKIRSINGFSRIHLIGHSFGGRVVTSAANALPASNKIDSLLLLEAAYSHNGLAKDWDGKGKDGSFRSIIARPQIIGNTLITHSMHDLAVGMAYPLASRIMGQVASALGGPNDKFGGMGRNGAQHTPEAIDDFLLPVGEVYEPLPTGKTIRNLNGDGPAPKPTINNHSDVAKPEIAWAWLSNIFSQIR